MRLYTKDLRQIGHTTYSPDIEQKYTSFICNMDTAGVEGLLLREILHLTGHKITSEEDYWPDGEGTDKIDWQFNTDYPFKDYFALEEQ